MFKLENKQEEKVERERRERGEKRGREMEAGDREEIRLVVEDGVAGVDGLDAVSSSSSGSLDMCLCRICHDEEEESSTSMEAPCACCGTLKFAHRSCIQRWCDEKGSNICEICLQKFEPGYSIPEKKALVDVGVTIRGSLEVPRLNYDPNHPEYTTPSDNIDATGTGYAECSSASARSASCCRSVALTLTIILLIRHLYAVVSVGADYYAFTLLTVYLLRASGILLPFFLVLRFISAVQQAQRESQLQQQINGEEDETAIHGEVEYGIVQHTTIEIAS